MNKILKVLALGAMALSTTACSDFLEVNPRTQVSETEFYKTEDDMMKGLYAVMNEMQTRMPEVWSYSSLLGDESETGGGIGEGSYKTKWDTFTYDATSCFGAWGYGSWWNEWDFGLFNGVIAANLLIDKLAGCTSVQTLSIPFLPKRAFTVPFSITICLWGMSNSRLSNIIWQPVKCIALPKEPVKKFMSL